MKQYSFLTPGFSHSSKVQLCLKAFHRSSSLPSPCEAYSCHRCARATIPHANHKPVTPGSVHTDHSCEELAAQCQLLLLSSSLSPPSVPTFIQQSVAPARTAPSQKIMSGIRDRQIAKRLADTWKGALDGGDPFPSALEDSGMSHMFQRGRDDKLAPGAPELFPSMSPYRATGQIGKVLGSILPPCYLKFTNALPRGWGEG